MMKTNSRATVAACMFLFAAAVPRASWAGPASAPVPQAGPPACVAPVLDSDAMGDRAGTLSRYQQLPRECLQAVFMHCSAQAREGVVDFGNAAVCSMGYEALLRTHFAGNFNALLAWWRGQRDTVAAE